MAGELPKTFGGYTLVERLGVGGTASVFLGRKRLHDGYEWVALKCLHPHLVEMGEVAQMFLHEAELLSRLHHPNVCEILRYGTEDGVPFIATKYLKGASFDVLLKRMTGRLIPVDLMSWIIAEATAGLHHAHEATNERGEPLNIVHRDVSPQNIFVTFDGKVQLLDFGVAHAAIHTRSTQTGELKGKDGYMSPEQINAAELDRRSDVFSMGIVLWEAITGRRLFARANSLATALAISEQPAPNPRTVNPRVSRELAEVVLKALAIDPELRFATARELELALRSGADDLSPQIRLQELTRSVLDPDDRDSDTDLELHGRRGADQLWMDQTQDDDDSADLTEVAKPLPLPPAPLPPPEDATIPDIGQRDADSTARMRAPAKFEVDDTLSIERVPQARFPEQLSDVPPPKPSRGWRYAVFFLLISIAAVLGLLWKRF